LKIVYFTCGKPGRTGYACGCCGGWHCANAASAARAAVFCNVLAAVELQLIGGTAAIGGATAAAAAAVAVAAAVVPTVGGSLSSGARTMPGLLLLLLAVTPMRRGEPSYSDR